METSHFVHHQKLQHNQIEFGELTRQCLDRRIGTQATLVREVAAWEATHNADPAPVDWRFTIRDARIKLKRLYLEIHD